MLRTEIITVLVAVEAFLLLLPATLFYIGGIAFAILGFFLANRGTTTPIFLLIAGLLTIPGYGLFSLWWLVFKFTKISVNKVSGYIWGGVIAGALTAFFFILPYLFAGFAPPTPYISWFENFKTMLVIGGGPLIVLVTILLSMWLYGRKLEL